MAEYRPVAALPSGMRWSEFYGAYTMPPVVKKDAVARDAFKRRLAETLKEARRQANVTQEDVAGSMGIDNDTISRWEGAGRKSEAGKGARDREIRAYDLAQLADIYAVSGDLFLRPPERIDEIADAVRRARALRQAQLDAAAEAERLQRGDAGASAPRRRRPS